MRFPAMPVRSGRDATLDFEKLQGILTPNWQPVTFAGNWENYEAGTVFAQAQFTRLSGLVVVRGIVKKPTAWAPAEAIFTGLPAPERREGFVGFGTDTVLESRIFRLDIAQNGALIIEAATPPRAAAAMLYCFTNFSYIPQQTG